MTTRVVKASSKGQITLPKEWRNKFHTDNFLIKIDVAQILIKPVHLSTLEREEVIFDADRDNKGKSVSMDEMLQMLKKADNGKT